MKRNILLCSCLVVLSLGLTSYAQITRAYMGVALDPAPLPVLLTRHLGLDAGQGVRIRNITVDSPADRAGLDRDDIIIAFQGRTVGTPGEIVEAVRGASFGEDISLEVIQLGRRKTVQLELEAAPKSPEFKYPPEPEAMTTWRPGKLFTVAPDGQRWMEIPFDRIPDFDLDVNRFFRERHTYHHATNRGDYTIIIEGSPRDDDSVVIVQAGDAEHRTTVGNLNALPEKYQAPAREAVENARKNVRKEVPLGRRFRLPEPPRPPEVLQGPRYSLPRPDMDRLSERRDRTLEMLQKQMERLQQRMEALEEHNREILNQLRERTNTRRERMRSPEPPEPANPNLDPTI